jgi:hypothetical protein
MQGWNERGRMRWNERRCHKWRGRRSERRSERGCHRRRERRHESIVEDGLFGCREARRGWCMRHVHVLINGRWRLHGLCLGFFLGKRPERERGDQ